MVLPSEALSTHAVGEAHAYVQGESLKAGAVFLVRLSNSPITKSEGKSVSIVLCILIAAFSTNWKTALIWAVAVGTICALGFGIFRAEESSAYGASINASALSLAITIGIAAFIAETMAFFGLKIGSMVLIKRIGRLDAG